MRLDGDRREFPSLLSCWEQRLIPVLAGKRAILLGWNRGQKPSLSCAEAKPVESREGAEDIAVVVWV